MEMWALCAFVCVCVRARACVRVCVRVCACVLSRTSATDLRGVCRFFDVDESEDISRKEFDVGLTKVLLHAAHPLTSLHPPRATTASHPPPLGSFRLSRSAGMNGEAQRDLNASCGQLGYKTTAKKLDHIIGELDMNKDALVNFTEFMRPTAKKYKEEKVRLPPLSQAGWRCTCLQSHGVVKWSDRIDGWTRRGRTVWSVVCVRALGRHSAPPSTPI